MPTSKNNIAMKWVYNTKMNEKGQVEKHKERLVAGGFAQWLGINYGETFAPVVRLDIARLVLAIVAKNKWPIYQLDVKSVFLNGILEEEVYVDQPLSLNFMDKRTKFTGYIRHFTVWNKFHEHGTVGLIPIWSTMGLVEATMSPHYILRPINTVTYWLCVYMLMIWFTPMIWC